MTNEELNTALYKKVFAEQEKYREWLLSQPPDEILNHCYEYTVREDIVLALEEYDLSDKQCKALLKSPSPLADVFKDFEKRETDHMDNIWYGFGSRVEWCACFVSWCADQCSYIDTGVIPKFAGCVNGVQWFRDRGQWADNAIEPVPGMIIFFDWDNKGHSGPQDGQSDHVGIVWKVEDGIIYTVEGNSGDSCRVNQYPVGHYEILGYGIANY